MSCGIVISSPLVKHYKTDNSVDVLDLCDASTVVNISLQKKEKERNGRKRKYEPEGDVLDDYITICKIPTTQSELEPVDIQGDVDQPIDRVVKVVGWLERSVFKSHEESYNIEESERFITESWLDRDSQNPPLFTKNVQRTKVFLLEVEPNPDNEPLDLVSGYCYDGCKKFFIYSAVVWSQEDSYDIPLCPECVKMGIEKELRFMFKVKLRVMDPNGIHTDLNVWMEHAEEFLGCSTEDFISKSSVREAAVMPLRQYTLANTMYEEFSPLLDVNLVCIKNFFFVVNSSLKQIKDRTSHTAQINKSVNEQVL